MALACSYAMMRRCWERLPHDRPTFEELYLHISQYIEHMAGYLDMGFNPFAGEKETAGEKTEDGLEDGEESGKENENEEETNKKDLD